MRTRKAYYLYAKPNTGIFYCAFLDADGKKIFTRSTKTKDRNEANMIANKWLLLGIPDKNLKVEKQIAVIDVLKKFNTLIIEDKINYEEGLNSFLVFLTMHKNKIPNNKAINFVKNISMMLNVNANIESNEKNLKPVENETLFIEYLLKFWNYETSPYIKFLLEDGASKDDIPSKKRFKHILGSIKKYIYLFEDKNISLDELKHSHINNFFSKIIETGKMKLSSLNTLASAVKQCIIFAEENGLIKHIISKKIRTYNQKKYKSPKKDILTKKEAQKLFSAKENFFDFENYCINKFAVETACRIGEIQAIKLSDLYIKTENDKEECWVLIEKSWNKEERVLSPHTKTKNSKTVKLSSQLFSDIKKLINENPFKDDKDAFLFYNKKTVLEPISYSEITNNLKNTMRNLGIEKENFTFHSYRHLAVVILLENNFTARDIMLMTGHTNINMVNYYGDHETSAQIDRKVAMVDSINDFLEKNEKTA